MPLSLKDALFLSFERYAHYGDMPSAITTFMRSPVFILESLLGAHETLQKNLIQDSEIVRRIAIPIQDRTYFDLHDPLAKKSKFAIHNK